MIFNANLKNFSGPTKDSTIKYATNKFAKLSKFIKSNNLPEIKIHAEFLKSKKIFIVKLIFRIDNKQLIFRTSVPDIKEAIDLATDKFKSELTDLKT